MSTYQQTNSPSDETREARPNEHAEALVTVQDAARSLQGDHATGRHGIKDGTAETIIQPKHEHRPFAYPPWPTSKPGPEATFPSPGQKTFPTRTDQIVYECYDQERGMSCVPPPTRVVRENSTRPYLSHAGMQEVESEAIERWLDDGGASDNESAYDARGFSPLQFFRP